MRMTWPTLKLNERSTKSACAVALMCHNCSFFVSNVPHVGTLYIYFPNQGIFCSSVYMVEIKTFEVKSLVPGHGSLGWCNYDAQ